MRHCLHTKYWAKNGSDSSSDSKVTQVFMNMCMFVCVDNGYLFMFSHVCICKEKWMSG